MTNENQTKAWYERKPTLTDEVLAFLPIPILSDASAYRMANYELERWEKNNSPLDLESSERIARMAVHFLKRRGIGWTAVFLYSDKINDITSFFGELLK